MKKIGVGSVNDLARFTWKWPQVVTFQAIFAIPAIVLVLTLPESEYVSAYEPICLVIMLWIVATATILGTISWVLGYPRHSRQTP